MKKTLIFMIFSMLFCMNLFGQHKVEYNFMTKDPPAITFARFGNTSVFKINNINKFLYDVKIESSQSEFNSEAPAIFYTIFKYEQIEGSSANSEAIINLNKHIKAQRVGVTNQNDKEYLEKTIEIYMEGRVVSEAFDQLEETKTIKNKLIRMTLTDALDYEKACDRIRMLISEYPCFVNPEKLLSSFQRSYVNFKTSLNLYSINAAVRIHFGNDDGKLIESTSGLTNEIEDLKKKVDKYDYLKLFEEINQLMTELKNENNYYIISDPVQAKKDIINYSVKISPRNGVESLIALDNRNFNIEIPIKGGIKINFSTGLFVATNLNDRKYSKTASSADTSISIITEDKNNSIAQLSLGALMHVSPRCIGQIKPALTFGLGLNSTDLSNTQIYIGGSAMFGSQERFIISTGVSLANIDYLSGKYSLDTPINNSEIDNALTEKSLRAGWFIGFTYNLTNKKKE